MLCFINETNMAQIYKNSFRLFYMVLTIRQFRLIRKTFKNQFINWYELDDFLDLKQINMRITCTFA